LHPSATWYSALDNASSPILGFMLPAPLPLTNATVRQVAHVSLGGSRIRLKFSNRYGASPLPMEKVRIASSLVHGAIDVGTDTAVTFGGSSSFTIDPGKDVWSDELDFDLAERDDLAVSMFVAGTADVATEHRFAQRTNYVSTGDATSTPDVTPTAQTISSGYWLTEIDVLRSSPANVIVGFGDSITDGNGSTADANLRYPDQLSRLALASNARPPELSVVNAGIGGNRWLYDGLGDKASGRFATDALGVSGASHVIILLGINDIGFSVFSSAEEASAADIIDAITTATHAAKGARLKVFLGTLLPFAGSLYYTADGETKRGAVNTWIRSNGIADGVFDFDALLRDATDPTKYAASYDSGDHLHPNDAGYAVMAKAVDLEKLR
jgi:lysophospholipase L1-like esterase